MVKRLILWVAALMMAVGSATGEGAVIDRINGNEAPFSFPPEPPLLEVCFAPVFDADAALIRCGGQTVMIDCGSRVMTKRTLGMLRQMGVTEIDAIINSHPHHDHLEGLEIIAQQVRVKELRVCFPEWETETMKKTLKVCEKYGIPVTYYEDGAVWQLGDATIEAWLKGETGWKLNDRSAVMRVSLGDRAVLFTGDIDYTAQKKLVAELPPEKLDADILKYPHHGISAILNAFVDAVSPELAVITNMDIDRMKDAKQQMKRHEVPIAFTLRGPVYAATDGETWLVERIPIDPETVR